MKMVRGFLLYVLCCAVSLSLCHAQNSFGTIVGAVHDQSGSAVNNAPIQVLNQATGVVTTVRTQSDGDYTAINLIPGVYVVSTEVSGFAKAATVPTQLVVNQTLRIDLVLHPGALTQTVQVTAEGALIDTDSAAISLEISSREVSDLPLLSGNFIDLAVLSPGVVSDPNAVIGGDQSEFRSPLSGGDLYVGGGRGASNAYLIDGVSDNDPSFQTLTITPPIDDIQDVRLMSKDYSAEYGGSAAQLSIATKSGTNALHGTAYDFLRNNAMDAIDDFATVTPVLRYNRFGVAAGGPVLIPHAVNGRNKLFFFGDYEGVRSHTVSTGLGAFPTQAELAGNFGAECTAGFTTNDVCSNPAQQLYEPGTVTPIPGNVTTNYAPIDATAAKIIAAGLFPVTAPTAIPGINFIAPLDSPDNIDEYSIRIDAHLGAKDSLFARFSSSQENYSSPAVQPYGGSNQTQSGKNIAVNYTHIFTTNFINDLHFGLNRPISIALQDGANGTVDIPGSFFTGTNTNPLYWGAPYLYFSAYSQVGGEDTSPLNYITTDAKLTDAVTWIHGPHTVQAGLDVGKVRYKETNSLLSRGLLEDFGLYTSGFETSPGDSVADFLLGDTLAALADNGLSTAWYDSWAEGGYLQDNWKLNTRLTFNLGVRYDYTAPMREEFNRVAIFDPTYPGGRILTPSQAAVTEANSPLVAYTPDRDITEPTKTAWAPRIGISYRPFGNTVIRAGYGIYYDANEYNDYFFPALNEPFVSSYEAIDDTYFFDPVKLDGLFPPPTTTVVPGVTSAYTLYRQSRTPYVEQWNLDIEHELPGNMMFEVGYVGSSGSRLQCRLEEGQGILNNPGPNATVTFPFPNFASVPEDQNESSSNYNALIGRFEKRFSHGFSLLAHYTYAKALGTASALGNLGSENAEGYMYAWDKRLDYGPQGYDIKQSFVFSPIWELPFGRGRMLANNAPAVVNAFIGGWQAAGIFTAHTGFPFSIEAASDSSETNSDNPRAQVVGNPWGPHAKGLAFNTAAFAQPATGTFGDSSNGMMRGLGLNNTDFSLIKTTTIHESLNFQIRFEAFNLFNEGDIGPFPDGGIADPTYGEYLGVQEQARTLQVAGKINF